MATKSTKATVDASSIPNQPSVDAEVTYTAAQTSQASKLDKQWLEETSQGWAERQASEKAHQAEKSEGQAVINVAAATGAVGDATGATLIVADASDHKKEDDAAVAVKKKEDDSNDKGGYLLGGLGLLGLVGIAAANGGGGGGGSSAPLNLDGLVIDDPVANAIVFRDIYGDGYLRVIDLGDGNYLVDPDQAVVVTNDEGKFANLGGSGLIVSTGINRLPIKVFDEEDGFDGPSTEETADVGDKLFSSEANFERDVSINDGNLAYIVGENQVFDSIVVSSGLELRVQGADVTLVTGVTGLVLAYATLNDLDIEDEGDVREAIIGLAEIFGSDLTDASDEEFMSFLLGGYDIAGIESAGNLNQEIYSVINSLTFASESLLSNDELTFYDHSFIFSYALTSIASVQQQRFEDNPDDPNLQSFALNEELLDQVIGAFFVAVEQFDDFDDAFFNEEDRQLFIDIAKNHADFGGGAPDIYHSYSNNDLMNIVNDEGVLLEDFDVEVAGNITLLNNNSDSSQYLDFWSTDLMSSNILSIAYANNSFISTDIRYATNASASEMSNGTLTYDPDGDELTSLGDITVKASGYDSWSHINFYSSDLTVSGNILVEAGDALSHAELDFDWDDMEIHFDDVDVTVNAFGTDSYAYFEADDEADHDDFTGRINNIHVVANREGVNNANVVSGPVETEPAVPPNPAPTTNDGSFASADIHIDGEVGNITLEAFNENDSVQLDIETAGTSMDDPISHTYSMDDLLTAGWSDLTIGQKVELRLGFKNLVTKNLVATITADDFVDGNLSVDKVIEKLMLDSDFSSLNVLLRTAGEWNEDQDVESGITVRWLDPDSLDYSVLKLAGDVVSIYETSGDSYSDRSVEFTESIITLNTFGENSTINADIEDGTGEVDSIAITASGESSDADLDIELFGSLGDVTVTASGRYSEAQLELESTYGYLEYDNSVINVSAMGEDSNARLFQESYATGVIDSITVENIGSIQGEDEFISDESLEAYATIGGDITIDSEINVYSRSSTDIYIDNGPYYNEQYSSRLLLGNLYRDYGLTSVFNMDDVAITVEAYGQDANSELSTYMDASYNGNYITNVDSVITGNITELNVIASGYHGDLTPVDPTLTANATSSVDINLHGSIEEINITADHVSNVYAHLAGDIDAELLDVAINNSNSSRVDLHLHDVQGEINSINVDTSNEGASTYIEVDTSDSIEEVHITTRSDAETVASLDINGAGNFIENLTIRTLGTSIDEDYTTVTDVIIDQESHGGVVNIYNSVADRWADTRLTYNGNYQADQITINGQSPRQASGNVFEGINDSPSITNFDIFGVNYIAGQTANIDGFGSFSISANGDYTFVADNDWSWNDDNPNIMYDTDTGVTNVQLNLERVFNDGAWDSFGLQINMGDQDVYSITNATPLENNMTTIYGLTNGVYDNIYENYIQFNDLDDANYTYEPNQASQQGPLPLNISHYSDGLTGWRGGDNYFDNFEGSRNIGNGFYGSFNEFFDAAQYGIASEYVFIDLAAFEAAGNTGFDDEFDTTVALTITWLEADGSSRTIYLNADLADTSLGGDLGGEAGTVVSELNADANWDDDLVETSDVAWSSYDDNLTVFANDTNTLGIRIGEGSITNVTFETRRWERDTPDADPDTDLDRDNVPDTGSSNRTSIFNLDDIANFESSVNGQDARIQYVEGGGYFFGMVLNDDTSTYRGILAMDDDGEGVTKLIELADVIATDAQADAVASVIGNGPAPGTDFGYDEFSSAYIGIASGYGPGNWPDSANGFDYETTASRYLMDA